MFKTKSSYNFFLGKNRIRQTLINNSSFNSKDKNSKNIILRNTPLDSYLTFNKSISNSIGSKISYEDYLLKKLSYFRKINRELNIQYKNMAEKAKLLFKDLDKNKSEYLMMRKEYEDEIKINKEIKSELKNILIKNEEDKEINELKEEQNSLLMTLKSKDKIINNLKNTLNVITKEIDEDKKMNESIINKKNNQILELKKVLNNLNAKFEENAKIINSKKEEKEKEKLKNKNKFSSNYLNAENKENLNPNKIQEDNKNNIIAKNTRENKKDSKIPKENKFIPNKNNKNNSFSHEQRLLTITEKPDNTCDSENKIRKLSIINTHKRTKSNDINVNKNKEQIEYIVYSYTEGNVIKDMNKTNKINKDSFYLYSITQEGKLIEFDLMEKKFIKNNTNQIKDWNIFIPEYSSNYEGSLLLNTFQGLFILTGKYHQDLYYYSKKYNSISKINAFNSGHKYGALLLTPNSENIIAIGGETKEVEMLNIENGQIQQLPNLLTKRINSAYTFIGDKLFAFFGKYNNQIEYLNMANKKNWELIKLKRNYNKIANFEGLAAFPLNENEILFLGNISNNKAMKFNYNELKIEYEDIVIESKNKKYKFDKDKYFNNFINFEKFGKDGNYLSQFVGIDSTGNIHYFNNDFTYSIINYE